MIFRLLFGVIVFFLAALSSGQFSGAKQRVSLDESHVFFNVKKQRQYEKRSGKLKQQSAKLTQAQRDINDLNDKYSEGGQRFCNTTDSLRHQYLSMRQFGLPAIAVAPPERAGNKPCSFLGAICSTENAEHELVATYISKHDTVLETGARYGTTSCAIARQQGNSGKLVSVEPDHRVWNLLDENRIRHHCNFWMMRGVVADKPATVAGTFYSTRSVAQKPGSAPLANRPGHDRCTRVNNKQESAATEKRHYTYEELQEATGLRFTILLIDCEGCIETLFAGNSKPLTELLVGVHTIILEADMPIGANDCEQNCVNYTKWVDAFKSAGLLVVHKVQDPVYSKIFHYVFKRVAS